MPITPTYPGVYIEELPSGVHSITGTATSITAFIGRAKKGPVNEAKSVQCFADYERKFGGLWDKSTMSFAVQQYFMHGGRDALIVRVIEKTSSKASISLKVSGSTALVLEAADQGAWGDKLRAAVDHDTQDPGSLTQFNLLIQEYDSVSNTILSSETFRNLSVISDNSRFITKVLEQQSNLVRVKTISTGRPDKTTPYTTADPGSDGNIITDFEILGSESDRTGIYALDTADLFNILCIPPLVRGDSPTDAAPATLAAAAGYCKGKRAMLIVDPPQTWTKVDNVNLDGLQIDTDSKTNVAVYFPRLKMVDPLKVKDNIVEEFVPCGAVAGIWARTDAQRGIWKAPAGQEASLAGVQEFTCKLTDAQNGTLNQLGLNCLRSFPVYGNIVWGGRTLAGADRLASEWKYIPVRRTALFIEESLYRGTKWVVFEPNDEPLWAQIRLNIGAFMHDLFRKGAFQGTSPKEAYFVKCDKETTTQIDIDHGIVNIMVGFAPLKPAEFVIIQIQQMAGNIQT
jgi:hypothetical protein